jgi:hypothetical protein
MDDGIRELLKSWQTVYSKPVPVKPVDLFAKFDDVDLMMELIKRGYAVHLPLENVDKVR